MEEDDLLLEPEALSAPDDDEDVFTAVEEGEREGPISRREYAASLTSLLNQDNPDKTFFDSYDEINQFGITDTMTDYAMVKGIESMNKQTLDVGESLLTPEMSVDDMELTIGAVKDVVDSTNSLRYNPIGPEILEARVHAPPEAMSEDIMKYAFNRTMTTRLAKMADALTFGDIAADFAWSFLPGRDMWNKSKAVDGTPLLGAFGAADKLAKSIEYYQTLSLEEQKILWPELEKHYISTMGEVQGVSVLQKFLKPGGAYDVDEFNNVYAALDSMDVVDAAILPVSLAVASAKLIRRHNKARALQDLGDYDTAADVSTAALVDPSDTIADKAGIDKVVAANNASPLPIGDDLNNGGANLLTPHVQARLAAIRAKTKEQITAAVDQALIVTPIDEGNVQVKLLQEEALFKKSAADRGLEVDGILSEQIDETTFKVSGYVFDSAKTVDGKPRARYEERTWELTLDNNGEYSGKIVNVPGASPKAKNSRDPVALNDVQNATLFDEIGLGVAHSFAKTYKQVDNLLKGGFGKQAKRDKVGDVLLKGDEWQNDEGIEVGKTFSVQDLKDDFKLTDDEIEYYYGMRTMYDTLGDIQNTAVRKELAFQGYKGLNIKLSPKKGDYIQGVGKPMDIAQAKTAVGEGTLVFNSVTGRPKKMSKAELDKAYESGAVLTKSKETIITAKGEKFDLVLANATDVGALPARVIKAREGYVPRVYKYGVYATQIKKQAIINGKAQTVTKTVRLYDNKAERDADMANVEAHLRESGESNFEIGPVNKDDMHRVGLFADVANSSGKLFTSTRAQNAVPFGSNATKADRLDPIQSMERLLNHVSVHYPRNTWRVAMLDRLEKLAKAEGIENFDVFTKVTSNSQLENLREQYLHWSKFQTAEEKASTKAARAFYEWMAGPKKGHFQGGDSKTKQFVFNLRHKDPSTAMRSVAFHTLLGFWNPAQLWIQGQAATVALSLVPPKHATGVLKGHLLVHNYMHGGDGKILGEKMAQAFGVDKKNGEAILNLYKGSGLDQGVRAVGDLASANLGVESGFSALKRLTDKNLVFYQMGERFNRRFSFMVSMARYLDNNPKVDLTKLSANELNSIVKDAKTFMLDMSTSNRATWQRGVWSLPTQFMQVQTKFIEEIMFNSTKTNLSKGDRARIVLGQLALYGAAGIPFFGNSMASALGSVMGMDEEELATNEIAKDALNGGIVQSVLHNILGAEADVAGRTAILDTLDDLIIKTISGDASFLELMSGAAGNFPKRAFEGFVDTFNTLAAMNGVGSYDFQVLGKQAIIDVVGLFSSADNVMKAVVMNKLGRRHDSTGNPIFDDPTFAETAFQAIGFSPSAVDETYDLVKLTNGRGGVANSADQMIIRLWKDAVVSGEEKTPEFAARMNVLFDIGYDNPQKAGEARERIWKKINNPETVNDKVVKQWIENQKEGIASEWWAVLTSNAVQAAVPRSQKDEE